MLFVLASLALHTVDCNTRTTKVRLRAHHHKHRANSVGTPGNFSSCPSAFVPKHGFTHPLSDAGCCMLGMLQRFMELFIGLKTCPAWQIAPSPGTDRYCDVGNVRTTLPLFDKFDECCTSGDMEVWNMQDNTSSVKCKRAMMNPLWE